MKKTNNDHDNSIINDDKKQYNGEKKSDYHLEYHSNHDNQQYNNLFTQHHQISLHDTLSNVMYTLITLCCTIAIKVITDATHKWMNPLQQNHITAAHDVKIIPTGIIHQNIDPTEL